MKVSISTLKTWMSCPLQARFKEVERRPYKQNAKASFGVCIHEALEQYNNHGDVDRAIDRFLETWDDPSILNVVPEVWPKYTSYGKLREKGIQVLRLYDEKNKWENRQIITQEHRFCVPIGDHLLSGIVDVVEAKRSGRGARSLRIVDYKTNSKAPTKMQLAMDIQFTAYVYASLQPEFWLGNPEETARSSQDYLAVPNGSMYMEAFHNVDRRAVWHDLWNNKEIDAGRRDDMDFLRLYRCITEVANAIEKEVYVPNISGDSCTWCDYTDLCSAVGPIRDILESPEDVLDNEGMF